ncbi:hypothetical protein ACTQ3J_10170 [Oscillospiraceae bacterium LCP25S3_E3]
MLRKGKFCKYNGKIYRCATCSLEGTVLLRSHDKEDLEKNGFKINPSFGKNKFNDLGRYIKEVPDEYPRLEVLPFKSYKFISYGKLDKRTTKLATDSDKHRRKCFAASLYLI